MNQRHSLSVRLWHWINAAALIILFMSGLNISNAHRYLYWGDYGFDPADAWTSVMRFPGWSTLPQYYDLAAARDWHSLGAWLFSVPLLAMWIVMLVNGHFWRDIRASRKEWRIGSLRDEVAAHLRGKFGLLQSGYNGLQKIAYGVVYAVLLPMMIFTGLAISPGFEPAAPWLVDILGGRQSARSLHFIFAWAVFGFFVIHVAMVLLSHPLKRLAGMVTGGRDKESGFD
ncbi:cytochrome b/b6 domain-containing protein [Erythrobacter ani]|uniref:Cytochrome b/b6 domain-containing protein n=1 Tax=Erythrobacter ani TaxID=2827235 RepID=A0ABS6SP37_9SPHN|nr:cytochrome b/b6 domain-containing protein [Erythrobacter ani]MBV7266772.1 cytochrome b/b6 domain-containing protein [Erythrobacter ani]